MVEAKTVVVTNKTTTTTIRIGVAELLKLIQAQVLKETGTKPELNNIEFDSDMGLVHEVSVHIEIIKQETV